MLAGALCEMPVPTSKKYCAEVRPRAGSGRLVLGGHHLTDACALTAWPSLPCTVMHRLTMRMSSAQTGPVLFAWCQYTRLHNMVSCYRDYVQGAQHPCASGSAGHAAGHSSSRSLRCLLLAKGKGWCTTQGMCITRETWPGRWRGGQAGWDASLMLQVCGKSRPAGVACMASEGWRC